MQTPADRLKVLINSSTPIVVIETVEERRAVDLVRTAAAELKVPVFEWSIADGLTRSGAAVFDKYVGETEKRIKRLFQVAEELAPVVLWIDELEKVFAGSGPGSASSDAGVSSRLLGSFLSWMQDRKQSVFVAATSNDVTALPPELIRKGRFDELFFVDLPTTSERRTIFELDRKSTRLNSSH